jgi:hypothetical protein
MAPQRTYKNCSWGRVGPHDGSKASSRGLIQVVVEFELEVDPDSKSTAWLYKEILLNFSRNWLVTTSGSVMSLVSGSRVMVR